MFIKRLFIVIIIIWGAAYGTGMLFDHLYKKRWSTLFFEKTNSLIKDSTRYDIIYLGNSRVHFGINPYYVDSITKLNSYNFANGGADALDILLTAQVYLQYHAAPNIAVISVDMGALTPNESLKTCFHYLFYLQNNTMNKYMKQAGFPTTLINIFPFTKYSFFDEYNRTSIFVKGKPYPEFDHNIYKGFLNIQQEKNSKAEEVFDLRSFNGQLWDTAITYIRNTVLALQQKGTTVIFVYPPEKMSSRFKIMPFRKTADSIYAGIANEFKIKQFHFEDSPLFTDDYFTDELHLNEPGSRIYSIALADSIKKLLMIR
ncbi:MAG: hypothetical protein ABIN36_08730 [Ferruginibacter sp.]